MSLLNNGIDAFGEEIANIIENMGNVFNSNSPQPNNSIDKIPLSENELTAFKGLCAIEGKSAKDKMAELIKEYIEKKQQQMKE